MEDQNVIQTLPQVEKLEETKPFTEKSGKAKLVNVEESKRLFEAKNAFLSDIKMTGHRTRQLDIEDFFTVVFARDDDFTRGVLPFENPDSKELNEIWIPQKQKNVRKIDYSGYGCWRYCPVVFYVAGKKTIYNKKKKAEQVVNDNRHKIIYNFKNIHDSEQDPMEWLRRRQFAICAPITYVGNTNKKENSRYLYAFAFDLDGVDMAHMKNLFFQTHPRVYNDGLDLPNTRIPLPNIITNSGNGFHLYYLLQEPIPLYERNWDILDRFKSSLTEVLWNDGTSNLQERQKQNIHQGFRLPGTLTKFGSEVTSWHFVDAPYYTLGDLCRWMGPEHRLTEEEIREIMNGDHVYNPTGVTRQEAARLWPEWYARVIVEKQKGGSKWHVNRAVYDWWLKRLKDPNEKVAVTHRFWCILTLVVYAVKCDIPEDEAWRDAVSLIPRMESLTVSEDNHFTVDDVDDAFRAYKESYNNWPIHTIIETTGLDIERNKRNGQNRYENLEDARYKRDRYRKRNRLPKWDEGCGRKVETLENSRIAAMVRQWMIDHPNNKNKSQCARDLTEQLRDERTRRVEKGKAKKVGSVTRKTVAKWWALLDDPMQKWDMFVKPNLQPIEPTYQETYTSDEFHKWLMEHGTSAE